MSVTLVLIQVMVSLIVGAYFLSQLLRKKHVRSSIHRESKYQVEQLKRLRTVSLSIPLSERTRPQQFSEIIGQEDGVRALCAALCGENPQHVLIYGPPGVGKTCAARLVMNQAKSSGISPFLPNAEFIEMDATCIRYDERNIADPLIGSVHDPIYQGAGAFGIAGLPQPKAGAVTKAHGGILFLDEIGELSPYHLNKLLKVLEDRHVYFESAYYCRDDKSIPSYIHDIFHSGLPADFRLIGATTKSPRDISPAIRSRCMEVFFRQLFPEETVVIAKNAAIKSGFVMESSAAAMIGDYASNGRDAVNMVQMAGGIARQSGARSIDVSHIRWVVETGRYAKRPMPHLGAKRAPGCVNALAVYGSGIGTVIEIESVAIKSQHGSLTVTGLVDEEELGTTGKRYRKKSASRSSVENVLTALKKSFGIDASRYDIHINLLGSTPVDGPSAGAAIALSVFTAVTGSIASPGIVVTGEVSLSGDVRAVGGISAKLAAAKRAGAAMAVVPVDNIPETKNTSGLRVAGVGHIKEVMQLSIQQIQTPQNGGEEVLSAKGEMG